MNHDDRMVHEHPTPLRSIHGRTPVAFARPARTPEDQLSALHGEVDDLHERDMRISAQVTLLRLAVLGLVWHAVGFWPVPWLWDLAATNYQTIFVAGGVIGLAVAGVLAAVPSLLRRYGWMS